LLIKSSSSFLQEKARIIIKLSEIIFLISFIFML
jgi:hypothetical protein